MKRLLFVLSALALVITACGSGDAAVATIGTEIISFQDLADLRPGDDARTPEDTARDLELMVITRILRQGAVALGIEVTDEEIAAELELIKIDVVAAQGIPWEEVLEAQQLTDGLVDEIVVQQLLQTGMLKHFSATLDLTDTELNAAFNSQIQALSDVCASHILFDAEDEALAEEVLATALTGDEELFAELAVEHSIGPSGPDGGDLGCASPAGYVPTFGQATLDAEIGVAYGPVETQFGHHLILVTSREVPVLEDIEAEIRESALSDKATNSVAEWFQGVLAEASVTIDEAVGTWDTNLQSGQLGITPAG